MPAAKATSSTKKTAKKVAAPTKKATATSKATASKKATAKKATARRRSAGATPVKRSAATRQKMAQSQQARRAVSGYLEALHTPKRRGRQVSVDTLRERLREAEQRAAKAVGVARLDALKAVHELEARIKDAGSRATGDLASLERAFVKHAKGYAERKGIPHHVWRRAGVPASVLQKAGIKRDA